MEICFQFREGGDDDARPGKVYFLESLPLFMSAMWIATDLSVTFQFKNCINPTPNAPVFWKVGLQFNKDG